MGVADFELNKALPKNLKSEMPTIEELEAALESEAKKFKQPLYKKVKAVLNKKIREQGKRRNPYNIKNETR